MSEEPPTDPNGPAETPSSERKFLSVRQAAFIGVGAMVGAGIFALLGAAGEVAGAAVWLSFLLAGVVAGLQGYSFAKLGARYPSAGVSSRFSQPTQELLFTLSDSLKYKEDAMNRLKVAASTLMLYCSQDSEPKQRSAPMGDTVFSSVAAFCPRGACRSLASLLLAFGAMAVFFGGPVSVAKDSKGHTVLPAPSSGKAIVCIYRTYRFTGSSSHDEIFVNGDHLGKLLSSEYEFTEVAPGTVVISGFPKEYYGSVIMSAMAAAKSSQAERTRAGPV